MQTAILEVSTWYTICSACGKDADPQETTHATLLGYGPQNGKPGCGAEFVAITAITHMGKDTDDIVAAMRPDLPSIRIRERL